jgi:hypothetical protein
LALFGEELMSKIWIIGERAGVTFPITWTTILATKQITTNQNNQSKLTQFSSLHANTIENINAAYVCIA